MGLPSNHENVTTVDTKWSIFFELSDACCGSIFGMAFPFAKLHFPKSL